MSRTNKYCLLLSLAIGIFAGIGIYTAQAITIRTGSISEYIPTLSGATEATADLSCDEEGYHKFTFHLFDVDTGGTQTYDGYYAYITYYKITLHSDFVNNVDMDRLSCSTPFKDASNNTIYIDGCNDSKSQPQEDGDTMTTTITKTNNHDGTYTIQWAYTGDAHPWVATFDGMDTFEEIILFYGNDTVETGDTATSDAEIFWYIYGLTLDNDDDETDFSSWEREDFTDDPIDDNPSIGFDNENWYTDGDTAVTTFEACEEELYCDQLSTNPTTFSADDFTGSTAQELNLTATDQKGDAWSGTYNYSSDGSCQFRTGTSGTWHSSLSNTTDTDIYVKSCSAGDTISVEEVDYHDYPYDCEKDITITEAAPYCKNLNITTPTSFSGDDFTGILGENLVITTTDQNGDSWSGSYEYSAYDADGNLAACRFADSLLSFTWENPHTTTDEDIYVKNCDAGDTIYVEDVDYPDACSDEISVNNRCDDLSITSPTEITVTDLEADYVTITIATEDLNGDAWDGNYTYTAYSSDGSLADGEFYKSTSILYYLLRTNPYSTDAETVYYFGGEPGDRIVVTEDDYAAYCSDEITAETETGPYCGNGIVETGEQCDDANTNNNDSCSNTCTTTTPYCGNGIVETGETCDDGNTDETDACLSSCTTPGGPPGGPTQCGNGVLEPPEECDDGNTDDTDSCSNSCTPNNGPGGCTTNCGPGGTTPGGTTPGGTTPGGTTPGGTTPGGGTPGGGTPTTPGEIQKNVFTLEHEPLDVAYAEDTHIFYDIIYTAGTETPVTITDTIADGITGSKEGTMTYDDDLLVIQCDTTADDCHDKIKHAALKDDTSDYSEEDFKTKINTNVEDAFSSTQILSECSGGTDPCYSGNFDDTGNITLENLKEGTVVAITYHATMDSTVDCSNPKPFVENFLNTATSITDGIQDDANMWVLCTYLLTRNAGEVYFGKQPNFGHDISGYSVKTANKNTTGTTFTPSAYSNTDVVNRIASFIIDELVRSFSENFSVNTLADTLSENQIRVSRYITAPTIYSLTSLKINDLNDLYPDGSKDHIYRFKGPLSIDSNITIDDTDDAGGARTIIVEGGDLYLNGDITYKEYTQATDIPHPKDLPVIAFIVPDGDILIKPYVHKIDSVLYTTGGLFSNGTQTPWSPARLIITGAVFGDLEPDERSSTIKAIMDPDSRFAMGLPEHDGGAVVIRYDERLLLNPPPGLAEYTDATFSAVSR